MLPLEKLEERLQCGVYTEKKMGVMVTMKGTDMDVDMKSKGQHVELSDKWSELWVRRELAPARQLKNCKLKEWNLS